MRWLGGGAALAIADGAGSAAHAARGAAVAAQAALAALRAEPGDGRRAPAGAAQLVERLRAGCAAARQALEAEAAHAAVPLRALATTLVLVAWQDGAAASAHIGDGAALACRSRGWELLSPPEDGEYVNETRFLTDPDWEGHIRLRGVADGVEGILAFSDGCQRAALRHEGPGAWQPFPGFCDPLARFARGAPGARAARSQIRDLLRAPKLAAVSEDDKTLALLWSRMRRG